METPLPTKDPLAALRDPANIRLRCAAVTRAVDEGRSGWFKLDRSRLDDLAERLAATVHMRTSGPSCPVRGCWRAFAAGGVDRRAELDAALAGRTPAEATRARLDLAVIAALLGADPGPAWRYTERPGTIDTLALPVQRQRRDDLLAMLDAASGTAAAAAEPAAERAAEPAAEPATEPTAGPAAAPPAVEADAAPAAAPTASASAPSGLSGIDGLGVATLRAFVAGVFSADPADPLRADAGTLKQLDGAALRAAFQAGPSNPLAGLDGRAAMLRALGERLEEQAASAGGPARPSRLLDTVASGGPTDAVDATALLQAILADWAPIWRGGSRVLGLPAGDVWPHVWAGEDGAHGRDAATRGWVPLHHLGQQVLRSLVEPLAAAGVEVTGLDALTAPTDAAIGSLLLDAGVIVPREARDLARERGSGDDLVIEWRALTVTLMDEVAARLRSRLGDGAQAWPVAGLLEAGLPLEAPAAAGRTAPAIAHDGTVF